MTEPSTQVTWRFARSNWFLFANNLFKAKKPEENPEKGLSKSKNSSKFYYNPKKAETKGTVVYTPDGYGIIQDIKDIVQPILIKLNSSGKIKEYDPNRCFFDIPITIGFMSSGFKGEEQMTVPITIQPKDIVAKIEASFSQDSESVVNVQVFFKGRDLMSRSNHSLEKLGVVPNSKFIAVPEVGVPFTLSRFTNVYEGWGYSDKCINAIAFTTNKSIKIRGFGIFQPDNSYGAETRSFTTCGKFIKGSDDSGTVLFQKEIMVTRGDSAESKIFKFFFDRPIRIKAEETYACVQEAVGNYNCYSYYGDSGQYDIIGDKDVLFTFSECFSSVNNTNRSCGQIPEIYYYA